jgi:hypothetical protein
MSPSFLDSLALGGLDSHELDSHELDSHRLGSHALGGAELDFPGAAGPLLRVRWRVGGWLGGVLGGLIGLLVGWEGLAIAGEPNVIHKTPTPLVIAQRPSQRIDRLELRPGKGVTIRTSVLRGTKDVFLFNGRRGQTMSLRMISLQNNGVFDVMRSGNTYLTRGVQGEWKTVLPQTGEYQIVISPTRGDAVYRLQVLVN